jgi:lexA repressor|nr:MAG TPA: Repressor protein CI [Caudoviricetes sp.]
MNMGEKIYYLRTKNSMTLEELGNKVGVGKSTVRKWENGMIANMKRDKILKVAEALNTTPAYLMGWDEAKEEPKKKGVKIPVLGRVAAGVPIEMIEDVLDYEEITEDMAKHGEYFALKIQGDSMTPRIWNNDVVIVRQQDDAENGDIVIAAINGDDAVCKRLQKYNDGIALISLNPVYDPIYLKKDEIDEKPVRILGKVVELRGKF